MSLRSQLREQVAEALHFNNAMASSSLAADVALDALAPYLEVVEAAQELLSGYLPDPCWYDHHGYCQEHGLGERPCCVERMRTALSNLPTSPADR